MKQKVKEKLSELRSGINSFIADVNVDDLKKSFGSMMKEAQKDFNKLMDRDLENVKKVLKEEKADFEKKARNIMEANRKELDMLQGKFEKLVAAAKKATGKKPAAGATGSTKKKASKKAPAAKPKAAAKKATKKKST